MTCACFSRDLRGETKIVTDIDGFSYRIFTGQARCRRCGKTRDAGGEFTQGTVDLMRVRPKSKGATK